MKASSHAVSLSCDKIMYLLHVLVAVVGGKCPNTEFSLVHIFPYSARVRKNTDQKKLRIRTLFTERRK